jgi:hypothetical protein
MSGLPSEGASDGDLNQLFHLLAFVLAIILCDGRSVPLSLGTFTLELTPAIILTGLAAGVALGTFGTLPPALRCLKPSLPVALRSS